MGWESWSEKQIGQQPGPDRFVPRWTGQENGFLVCTYWLVECLVRCGRRVDAVELFERTTTHANYLRLSAE